MKILYIVVLALVLWLGFAHHNPKPVSDAKPVVAAASTAPKPSEPHADLPQNQESAELLALTNADRARANLKPLTYDLRLVDSASDKCNDMLTYHYFGHDRGQGIFYFFPKAGITHVASQGENLAQGAYPPNAIEQAWMNSPAHRANVLGNYDSVGFSECADLVVEHFVLWPAIDKVVQ